MVYVPSVSTFRDEERDDESHDSPESGHYDEWNGVSRQSHASPATTTTGQMITAQAKHRRVTNALSRVLEGLDRPMLRPKTRLSERCSASEFGVSHSHSRPNSYGFNRFLRVFDFSKTQLRSDYSRSKIVYLQVDRAAKTRIFLPPAP